MSYKNLATLFQNRVYQFGNKPVLGSKVKGRWSWISWKEFGKAVEDVGRGLIALGVEAGDHVCIFSENRPEWVITDLAIQSIRAVSVPIHATSALSQVHFVIQHSQAKGLAVSSLDQFRKIQSFKPELSHLNVVFSFEETIETKDMENIFTLTGIRTKGQSIPSSMFYERLEQIQTDDLSTLFYTSGTTGEPKGVMLTHKNILSNCETSCEVLLPGSSKDTFLSFLPLSHALERTGGLLCPIYFGAKIAFAESIAKVPENLLEVRPTLMICVPRILEKIYNRVYEEVQKKPNWIKLPLLHVLSSQGESLSYLKHPWRTFLAKNLYKKIHKLLGGRIRYLVSGSAPLNPKIGLFLRNAGIEVLEGYGLTETSPVISANRPQKNKIGTVGSVLPGAEVRIAPDGEILVRGPMVMKGYYKDPMATQEIIDQEGFLHTGDIGALDSDGFLRLTDRKKEFLATSGGKKISPQLLENELKSHPLIEQACVVGDGRKYLTALLVPNFSFLTKKAQEVGISDKDRVKFINNPEVRKWFREIINTLNSKLATYETIKDFALLPQEFTIENEEITPTLKLRRKIIIARHIEMIEKMYNETIVLS